MIVMNMGRFEVIAVFFALSVISFCACKNSAKGMIEKVKILPRSRAIRYVRPHKLLREMFGLSHDAIPRFLCFEFCIAILFLALFPLNVALYLCTGCTKQVAGIQVLAHIFLILLDSTGLTLWYLFVKRR